MKHFASPDFWVSYGLLPASVKNIADKNFEMMKANPRHPSVRLKKAGLFWSARVGIQYRALAKQRDEELVWVWVGNPSEYD